MGFKTIERKREYHREYNRIWRKKNPITERAIRKKAYDNLIKREPDYFKRNYLKHRDTILAYVKKNQRKNNGLNWKVNQITKWSWEKDKKCGICGGTNHLEFHHWIYKLPVERKNFSTLCRKCHYIQHGGRRA